MRVLTSIEAHVWEATQQWKLWPLLGGFYFEIRDSFKSWDFKNKVSPAFSYYFLNVSVSPLSLDLVKLKHPSLARVSLLCCQSNKIITIWNVCVCVCWCISHQSWSSLPNPFPESTTDSLKVRLSRLKTYEDWIILKRTWCTARPQLATPVEVFATCRLGSTRLLTVLVCTFVWN